MKILKALWVFIGSVSTILGLAGFFMTGEFRSEIFEALQASYNYFHYENPVAIVPLSGKLTDFRLFPKVARADQLPIANRVGQEVRKMGIAFFGTDPTPQHNLCNQDHPVVIFHTDSERGGAESAASAITDAIRNLGYTASSTGTLEEHRDAGQFTRDYLAVCMVGVK
jgi:hypothetical protein